MKLFILVLIVSIVEAISAHAADPAVAAQLIGQTMKDMGAISSSSNDLSVEIVKGKPAIENLKADKLAVTKIEFDRASGTFTAYISGDGNLPFETAGTFHEITKLPVLNRKLSKDEIITKADISYIEIEPANLRPEYVTDEAKLIGKSTPHGILQSRPIILSQLVEPRVIDKNKQVTMVYSNNALNIKTAGVALENGTLGQTIKFRNVTSNRIVIAKIISGDTVQVQSADSILASN